MDNNKRPLGLEKSNFYEDLEGVKDFGGFTSIKLYRPIDE
jgi:hypothetical protein